MITIAIEDKPTGLEPPAGSRNKKKLLCKYKKTYNFRLYQKCVIFFPITIQISPPPSSFYLPMLNFDLKSLKGDQA